MIGAIMAKRKIRSSFDCLNRRDLDAFMANWHEEGRLIHPGNLSISGEIEGKEAVREWFQRFLDRFPGLKFTLNNVCVQNIFALGGTNVVTVEWELVVTDEEGKEYRNSGVNVINLRGGKAVLVRDYIFDIELHRSAWGES